MGKGGGKIAKKYVKVFRILFFISFLPYFIYEQVQMKCTTKVAPAILPAHTAKVNCMCICVWELTF